MKIDPENWIDEHVCEDLKKPYYRECRNCGHAYRKDEKAFKDPGENYFCNAQCVYDFEERLRAEHQERLYQEAREGGYL